MKKKTQILLAIVPFMLALVIFIFGDGLRRYYSGGFFALIGTSLVVHAIIRPDGEPEGGG